MPSNFYPTASEARFVSYILSIPDGFKSEKIERIIGGMSDGSLIIWKFNIRACLQGETHLVLFSSFTLYSLTFVHSIAWCSCFVVNHSFFVVLAQLSFPLSSIQSCKVTPKLSSRLNILLTVGPCLSLLSILC